MSGVCGLDVYSSAQHPACNIVKASACDVAKPQILKMHRQCSNLVKVGGKPVHDYIEGVVEGEVVDDDGPDGRLRKHPQPWCSWSSALLLRFSRSQWDGS